MTLVLSGVNSNLVGTTVVSGSTNPTKVSNMNIKEIFYHP